MTTETRRHGGTRGDHVTGCVIGAAIEVHRALGPGLLESVYEECLCQELRLRRLRYRRQVPLDLEYKGVRLGATHRIDLIVESAVVVELKVVERILAVHKAQLLTYLRLSQLPLGLLLNFNVPVLRQGIVRMAL